MYAKSRSAKVPQWWATSATYWSVYVLGPQLKFLLPVLVCVSKSDSVLSDSLHQTVCPWFFVVDRSAVCNYRRVFRNVWWWTINSVMMELPPLHMIWYYNYRPSFEPSTEPSDRCMYWWKLHEVACLKVRHSGSQIVLTKHGRAGMQSCYRLLGSDLV